MYVIEGLEPLVKFISASSGSKIQILLCLSIIYGSLLFPNLHITDCVT